MPSTTSPLDPELVQRVVETVTREVLLALSETESRSRQGEVCKQECAEGLCVQTCVDDVGQVVRAGASRVSAGLGAVPADRSIAGKIDHTLSQARRYA